jgi:signal transduction histidine kinase
VTDDIAATAMGKRIVVERAGDGRGEWDPARLAQVLQNLLLNALAYGDESEPVRVGSRGGDKEVIITVSNAGEPIHPDALPSLFDPLPGDEGGPAGRGLGLYIVNEIVTRHRGTVAVESDDARTTFTVTLPRARPSEIPAGVASGLKDLEDGGPHGWAK